MSLRGQLEELQFRLSDASLQLLPEYQERLKVLRALRYINQSDVVQLKVLHCSVQLSNINNFHLCGLIALHDGTTHINP